jgi:hypothetical protein
MNKKSRTAKKGDQNCHMNKKQKEKLLGLLSDLQDALFDQGYKQAIFNLVLNDLQPHGKVQKSLEKAEIKAEKLYDRLCALLDI